jgi:hypothetical protein
MKLRMWKVRPWADFFFPVIPRSVFHGIAHHHQLIQRTRRFPWASIHVHLQKQKLWHPEKDYLDSSLVEFELYGNQSPVHISFFR